MPSAIGVSPGKLYDALDAALGRMAIEIDEKVKKPEINGTGVELHTSKKVGRVKTFYEIRATIHSMDTVRLRIRALTVIDGQAVQTPAGAAREFESKLRLEL